MDEDCERHSACQFIDRSPCRLNRNLSYSILRGGEDWPCSNILHDSCFKDGLCLTAFAIFSERDTVISLKRTCRRYCTTVTTVLMSLLL